MKVKDIMSECPGCCTPDSTLQEAAELMRQQDAREIPVVDSRIHMRPLGIITEHDIACRVVAQGINPLELTVSEFMTPCATVTPEMSLDECLKVLEENNISRVPVVDYTGECCGIAAEADIKNFRGKKSGKNFYQLTLI